MMTNATYVKGLQEAATATGGFSTAAVRKMAVVNAYPEVLDLLEPVIDTEEYAIVFVDSALRAYSDIKRLQPSIIILCIDLDDPSSFQVMSMLKLDAETQKIPLVTVTAERGRNTAEEPMELPDEEPFMSKPPLFMH